MTTYVEFYTKADDGFSQFRTPCNECVHFITYDFKGENCFHTHRIKEVFIETWPNLYCTYWVRKLGGCKDFKLKEKTNYCYLMD